MRFEEMLVLITGIVAVIYIYAKFLQKKSLRVPAFVDWAQSFFSVLLLVLILRSFIGEPFRIPSSSMYPNLIEGDFIGVNKFIYGIRLPISGKVIIPIKKPQRGDILVFRGVLNNQKLKDDLIKRVIAIPGDRLTYNTNTKKITLNGETVSKEFKLKFLENATVSVQNKQFKHIVPVEQYIETIGGKKYNIYNYKDRNLDYEFTDILVPDGSYFVMGDNRDNSSDSRVWGFVKDDQVIGRAEFIWLSIDFENKFFPRFSRMFKLIGSEK